MKQKKRHHYIPIAYLGAFCDPLGRILLFPISPRLVVRGRTGRPGLRHNLLVDYRPVDRVNRFISRFGYRFVFATDRTHEEIIRANKHGPDARACARGRAVIR